MHSDYKFNYCFGLFDILYPVGVYCNEKRKVSYHWEYFVNFLIVQHHFNCNLILEKIFQQCIKYNITVEFYFLLLSIPGGSLKVLDEKKIFHYCLFY